MYYWLLSSINKSRLTLASLIGFLLLSINGYAQSLGDPVVRITFGSGTAARAGALSADSGSTTYTYSASGEVGENQYTITNQVNTSVHGGFVTSTDHTGNTGGYMMVVNGNITAGTVFSRGVKGLCEATTYQFGVWVKNVLSSNGILPNMVFHIYAADGTTELGSGVSTGDVKADGLWHNYTANFTLPAGTPSVIIKLVSNASGQVGNDFAVDDITFSPYGSTVSVAYEQTTQASESTCSGTSRTYYINATSSLASGYVQKLQAYINGAWADQGTATTDTRFAITPPATAGTYYYRLVSAMTQNIGSASCVVSSNQLTLVVTPGPTALISATDNTCLGSPTAFLDQSTSGGGTINKWAWDFGDGQTSTEQNPVHTYAAAGTYTVHLIVTNANGCVSDQGTKIVSVNTPPTAAFTNSTPACETVPVTFSDQSTAGTGTITNWIWDFGDGTAVVTKTDNQAFTHTFAAYGTFPVKLTVTTDKGCNSIKTSTLIINPLPLVDFVTPSICQSDGAANFKDATTIADNSALTYAWNFGDANANAARPNTSTLKNPSHFYSAAGTYTVTLTVTSGNNCPVIKAKTFTINGSDPKAEMAAESTAICSDHELVLTNQSTVDPGSVTKIDIYYEYGVDNTIMETFSNPAYGQIIRHAYPAFYSGNAKTYTVHMIAYSGATSSSCTGTKELTVTVLPVGALTFPALTPICQDNGPVTLAAKESNGLPGTGVYTGTGVTGSTFDPAVSGAGTFTITYTYTVTNQCSTSISRDITVNPTPKITVGPGITVLEGGSATLPATASGNGLTYLWSPATNLSNATVLNPTVSPGNTDITYTLLVTSDQGCTATGTLTVKVLKAPVVPNTFTPNADGVNDTWQIEYLDTYPDCTVAVFNRYGAQVFYSIGYPTPWNGQTQNGTLPVGVYYYVINPKHGRSLMSGSVTIVR